MSSNNNTVSYSLESNNSSDDDSKSAKRSLLSLKLNNALITKLLNGSNNSYIEFISNDEIKIIIDNEEYKLKYSEIPRTVSK